MRTDLIEEARKVISDPPILINMVSKRVAQLNRGRRPLIDDTIGLGTADIALKEIIEGLVVIDEEE
jgi:DNA-directed RNA polymerase subunit omega